MQRIHRWVGLLHLPRRPSQVPDQLTYDVRGRVLWWQHLVLLPSVLRRAAPVSIEAPRQLTRALLQGTAEPATATASAARLFPR